ncbi:hypothetical protein QF117_02240 [Vibrio sp. YMD68]|nr:hypothetical protein [Vibrio sp. YMD68]WGV99005.1 hypothetical protein QF117_02240 [Vibrio sp. YMD68]
MSDMLEMAAFQLSNPVVVFVFVVTRDGLFHFVIIVWFAESASCRTLAR